MSGWRPATSVAPRGWVCAFINFWLNFKSEHPNINPLEHAVIFSNPTSTKSLVEVCPTKIRAIKTLHYSIYFLNIFLMTLIFCLSVLNIDSNSRLSWRKSTVHTIQSFTWTPISIGVILWVSGNYRFIKRSNTNG